jgi:glycosyltransferase involved in cell wall biosynthesis
MKFPNQILVTVIIPTYNRAEKLNRALESLTYQTFKKFKVIVIDDGSTDKTRDTVSNYQRQLSLEYIYCKNSGGPAKPRNIGLFKTNTKYIAFLDSDDWWHKDKLKISLLFLKKGYSFVYHDLFLVNKDLYRRGVLVSGKLENYSYQNLINSGNIFPNSSVVMESILLKAVGGFDESNKLIGSEDYDAWIRVAKISNNYYRIPGIYGFYLISGDSISTYKNCIRNNIYLRKKYNLFAKVNGRVGPAWLMYGYARSLSQIGKYKSAYHCALVALRCKLGFLKKMKISCIILLSIIKILTKY